MNKRPLSPNIDDNEEMEPLLGSSFDIPGNEGEPSGEDMDLDEADSRDEGTNEYEIDPEAEAASQGDVHAVERQRARERLQAADEESDSIAAFLREEERREQDRLIHREFDEEEVVDDETGAAAILRTFVSGDNHDFSFCWFHKDQPPPPPVDPAHRHIPEDQVDTTIPFTQWLDTKDFLSAEEPIYDDIAPPHDREGGVAMWFMAYVSRDK